MKQRVMYNTYYEEFENFKNAIFGFLDKLSKVNLNSHLGQTFSNRIKDRFRAIGPPVPDS